MVNDRVLLSVPALRRVSSQAGIFSFAGFLTAYAWGCTSNYIGRKVRRSLDHAHAPMPR